MESNGRLDLKRCSKCNELKSISEFYVAKSICKDCYHIKNKEYYPLHKDIFENNRKRQRDIGYLNRYAKEHKEDRKTYRKKHLEMYHEATKRYLKSHPEKRNMYKKKYLKNHPEKRKIINARQVARKRKKGFYSIIVNIFPKDIPVDYHHIHQSLPFTVPIFKTIHQKYMNGNLSFHLSNVNTWIEDINLFNVSEFLEDKQ